MHFLIIDDSNVTQLMVQEILKENGHTFDKALNGEEALKKLEDKVFDLILLDWNMPVMDGPTFLEEYKGKKKGAIPVMMMTTENSPEKIIKAMNLGAKEYVMKPFTAEILLSKLEIVFM
jgi:two-component system, chemotaxis family, chemotaxis protein CheY